MASPKKGIFIFSLDHHVHSIQLYLEMKKATVFIVDDHPMVIEGMQAMLNAEPEIEFVGYAMSANSCKGFFIKHNADVVLLDINLPDGSGIDLCGYLKKLPHAPKILGISNFDSGTFIGQMMDQGADGYVLKNVPKEELLKAIFTVLTGKKYLSSDAHQKLKAESERRQQAPLITGREREVLYWIAQGMTNSQIADKLFVSVSTIDSHRKNLLSKLKVNNTASLLKSASENQLL
jgi:DNA-binding NarL/FixJ family response regulator